MAHAIWNRAANLVVSIIEQDLLITPTQRDAILEYVERLPVLTVVNLLATLRTTPYTLNGAIFADRMDVDTAFYDTHPYKDHFLAILNHLRVILGQPGWFPENSPTCSLSALYLHLVRNIEEDVGFPHHVTAELIACLEEYRPHPDVDLTENNDNDSISTATTIPVDPLEESQ